MYGAGNFWFPDNGEVFFGGCIGGMLSEDGQTVDEIENHNPGNGQFTLERVGVWHRQ